MSARKCGFDLEWSEALDSGIPFTYIVEIKTKDG
jgi:hypothetical protein